MNTPADNIRNYLRGYLLGVVDDMVKAVAADAARLAGYCDADYPDALDVRCARRANHASDHAGWTPDTPTGHATLLRWPAGDTRPCYCRELTVPKEATGVVRAGIIHRVTGPCTYDDRPGRGPILVPTDTQGDDTPWPEEQQDQPTR